MIIKKQILVATGFQIWMEQKSIDINKQQKL